MGVIGYTLSVPDNGTFMFPETTDLKRCEACGYPVDFLAYNPNYAFRKRAPDSKLDGERSAVNNDIAAIDEYFYLDPTRPFILERLEMVHTFPADSPADLTINIEIRRQGDANPGLFLSFVGVRQVNVTQSEWGLLAIEFLKVSSIRDRQ